MAYEECDSLRSCTHRALQLHLFSKKKSHYVDVINNDIINKTDREISVEMWLYPEEQPGKRQFVAGLWGPSIDHNDVWVLYINRNDQLVFELNHEGSFQKDADNTMIFADISTYYDDWVHICAVFDGDTHQAQLFLDGELVASGTNTEYPISRLAHLENSELSIQIGSTNALSNDFDNYRTFFGQMDEIRIWGRALNQHEIYCNKDKALSGQEDSLLLYYRCNEPPGLYFLCDASGHGNFGSPRSGAQCDAVKNRKIKQSLFVDTDTIRRTIKCLDHDTFEINVVDTSICGSRGYARIYNDEFPDIFTIEADGRTFEQDRWAYYDLPYNQQTTVQLHVDVNFVGTQYSVLKIRKANSCGWYVADIPVELTRITELGYDKNYIDFGLIKAGCDNRPYVDTVITIWNNSEELGSPRDDFTVFDISTTMPDIFEVLHTPLPLTLARGDSMKITVRFYATDTTGTYNDEIIIESNDKCAGSGVISLHGEVREIIGIFEKDGQTRIDTIDFGTVCLNFASDAVEYLWEDLLEDEDIIIENIIVPDQFIGKEFIFPVTLEPETGYKPNYFRYMPTKQGPILDSAIFIVRSGDCVVRKPVYFKGDGFFADISFEVNSLDYGTVVVGQEKTIMVTASNNSPEQLKFSVYLRTGDGFVLTGAKAFTIDAGQKKSFPLTFIPTADSVYIDELCFFEKRCYVSGCIPVRGEGIIQRFDYDPLVLRIDNVVGCQSETGILTIENLTQTKQTLSNIILDDPSGKFSIITPNPLPDNIVVDADGSYSFEFEYAPDDVTTDRADKAYLRYETDDGIEWSGKLYGTSAVPKIYVTHTTLYGIVEAGDIKRDTITIENISAMPIYIEQISVPQGFSLVYPDQLYEQYLDPRDSIMAIVDFEPTKAQKYHGNIIVTSSEPCDVEGSGIVDGTGIIIPLEVPLTVVSYGFVRPCDCLTREIPLVNHSKVFEMTIDSIQITSDGGRDADFFSWDSFLYSQNGDQMPYTIPPLSKDTLKITYCPNNLLDRDSIISAAITNIYAHGSQWEDDYSVYLFGQQMMFAEPVPKEISFPPTRVDTLANPQYFTIFIPDVDVNPNRSDIKLDSITFIPDDRVFFASDSLAYENEEDTPFPITIDTSGSIVVRVDFRPRSVRGYEARAALHFSEPCRHMDTTVIVRGSGFAPAFGLGFQFAEQMIPVDTFRVVPCDTVEIPIYSTREFPANVVDIMCRIGYDTDVLELTGYNSDYLNKLCDPFEPFIDVDDSEYGGKSLLLKNFCRVDSLNPIITLKFSPNIFERDTITISVDSIHFDTEQVILFHMIAESDRAVVIVQKPEIEIISDIDFDEVYVLDCKDLVIEAVNTGDVPLSSFDIFEFPEDIDIVGVIPPDPQEVEPGDTMKITVRFCPRRKQIIDTTSYITSAYPCDIIDSLNILGSGYAPEFPFYSDVTMNFARIDTISAQIGDTLSIPINFEKDFSAVRNDIEYWLKDLEFSVDFYYNPYALKFLSSNNLTNGIMDYNYSSGLINHSFKNVDSLRAGPVAINQFLVTVPDSIFTLLTTQAYEFHTDSIMFLDLIPMPENAIFNTLEKCNLHNLVYTNHKYWLGQNSPNPAGSHTQVNFSIVEKVPVKLTIYNISGEIEIEVLNMNYEVSPGTYRVQINTSALPSGQYYYILEAGIFRDFKRMTIIH